jgi:hypothetical protein
MPNQLRSAELTAAERHLERLREGRPETLETTSLHLDILRDLKRIHSHICSAAYSVLHRRIERRPRHGQIVGRRDDPVAARHDFHHFEIQVHPKRHRRAIRQASASSTTPIGTAISNATDPCADSFSASNSNNNSWEPSTTGRAPPLGENRRLGFDRGTETRTTPVSKPKPT